MAQALRQEQVHQEQLRLHEGWGLTRPSVNRGRTAAQPRVCAGCRAKEARYGFRPEGDDDPTVERPGTLCFECFRVEVSRRQLVRERMARGWNAHQAGLPLEDTLRTLDKRRRRAQIAARHAVGE